MLLPSTHYPLHDFDLRATHARTLLPTALASVSFGSVLVRVRVRELSSSLISRDNRCARSMCRVNLHHTFPHHITSASPFFSCLGILDIDSYLHNRILRWAGHVARMPKSRLPKRLMLSWVHEPRIAGGQEIDRKSVV